MSPSVSLFVAAVISYLIGSLTFGLWIARYVRGIDIREHGSRNIGATNVGRVIGMKWGLFCLFLDALKGLIPALILPRLLFEDPFYRGHATVLCGIAAIVGHVFPIYLRFRGGKGVATAAGVAGAISWPGLLAAVITFAVSVALSRFVALGSLFAAVAYSIVALAMTPEPFGPANWSSTAFAIAVPILIVVRHIPNIGRIINGTEAKIGSQPETPESTASSG
ncbi:glycerol-3-phosphate 1-O-acyltransferase PlsY [Stratiformator vulcanicus]|uniref:Glycerol-3-phosphate acyltransferase n=1 Tax=Stratiformator vulcanicus TaxID=2527980 RepID=A0A517QWX2_9PLAN|nr:glycerol-3-phosphate 1-O-acyltransferase PlsY [Stratiformator vulcanicus]QDT36162.1 Glycerol-3-phosphate acyltransferase [Stratiformator vulcanicus]